MGKSRKVQFDRHGLCPICRKVFRSDACAHSYAYVVEVVNRANSNMDKDVARLREQSRRRKA